MCIRVHEYMYTYMYVTCKNVGIYTRKSESIRIQKEILPNNKVLLVNIYITVIVILEQYTVCSFFLIY